MISLFKSDKKPKSLNDIANVWLPPIDMDLSQWVEKYAYLSAESSAIAGKWHSFPYQSGILDAYSDPAVERITMMKSARVGYTKLLNNIIGYHIHQDPCSILVVQPTVEDAQGYSKDEIAPMIRDTPCLEGLIAESKSRDSDNTILKKSFRGGRLYFVGANSPRGFRRVSVRVVLFDEIDGYPPAAGKEGDQIALGIKRSEWAWNRKIICGSTPTVKEISKIEPLFLESDQRFYYVPCPFCGDYQVLDFNNLKWPKNEPLRAQFECVKCNRLIDHVYKRQMVESGEWRATAEFKGHAGFFIWTAYSLSPNVTWGLIAEEFLLSKGDTERLKTYKNTYLAQTWEEDADQPEWQDLSRLCEDYEENTIPDERIALLTLAVDTQDDRLAVKVKGWAEGEESWLLYHDEFMGDPNDGEVWDRIDALLNTPFQHPQYGDIYIISACIDSGGHRTQAVYNFCRERQPRVSAIKGGSVAGLPVLGIKPTKQDVTFAGETYKNACLLWTVGSDTAKSLVYSRIKIRSGAGAMHWHKNTSDEYFMQLTAEKLVRKYVRGFAKYTWHKVRANEALDLEVYSIAAAIKAGMHQRGFWDFIKGQYTQKKDVRSDRQRPAGWATPGKNRGKWMSR